MEIFKPVLLKFNFFQASKFWKIQRSLNWMVSETDDRENFPNNFSTQIKQNSKCVLKLLKIIKLEQKASLC